MFREREEHPEVRKSRRLGEKYGSETPLFYVVYIKVPPPGNTEMKFTSPDKERTIAKAKELEQHGHKLIIAQVEPKKAYSRWIYQTPAQAIKR